MCSDTVTRPCVSTCFSPYAQDNCTSQLNAYPLNHTQDVCICPDGQVLFDGACIMRTDCPCIDTNGYVHQVCNYYQGIAFTHMCYYQPYETPYVLCVTGWIGCTITPPMNRSNSTWLVTFAFKLRLFLQPHSPNLEFTSGRPCAFPECREFQIQTQKNWPQQTFNFPSVETTNPFL